MRPALRTLRKMDNPVSLAVRICRSAGVRTRGFTLLECMIVAMLGAILAVTTLRVLGDARQVRGNARDRLMLASLAQGELDRLRTLPAAEVRETTETLTKPDWPEGVALQVITRPYSAETWQIDIVAARQSIEGKPAVRLSTLRRGVAP